MSIFDIISKPAFWIPASLILGGSLLSWFLSVRRQGARNRLPVAPFRPQKAKTASAQPEVTFADVAGLPEAVEELREVKEYLTDPNRFRALGAELPRGILLYGPPGSGKTLLARALAGEAGVPFYFVSAASFVEMFVGVGAARVRQLFDEAKRNAPSIVFIDELDAVGRRRNSDVPGEREFDHTLNQLLVELDGFAGSAGVLIIGATNRPELIDPALVRPGRFDRRINVDRPDLSGREAILRLHASRRSFAWEVDWREIAHRTAGLSGAELANIVNEASFLAARRHRQKISEEDVEEALDRMMSGPRTNRPLGEDEKRLIAYHEAGHALLSLLLRGIRPVSRISLVGRAGTFGKSQWTSTEDKEVLTRRELMAQLMVLLGGRAAERNTFGEPSTRAEDDLEQAATLARRMVERWAMTGRLELTRREQDGPSFGNRDGPADREVHGLLARAEQAAATILNDNTHRLRAVAEGLLQRESLSLSEITQLSGLQKLGLDDERLAPVRSLQPGLDARRQRTLTTGG
ncbi:MAG: ATP-dependent metallopeptidase FtsH/Yme1/Tma family protein [Actinomycetota bacterium]